MSGVEIEETELDIANDEIVNDMEVCEATVSAASDTKKAEEEKEKKVAEETRKLAMESLGQTQKLKVPDGESDTSSKQRHNATQCST